MSRQGTQIIENGQKECSFCHVWRPLEDFYRRLESSTGYTSQCRYCKNEKHPSRPIAPEIRRRYYLAHRYDMTPEEYEDLWEAQDGRCAICQKIAHVMDLRTGSPRRLAIDHDHQTGKIRGLLCHDCNVAIGHLNDDVEILYKAISYLEGNDGT
jgi:hypothetical protein